MTNPAGNSNIQHPMHDFIFGRELAEVYLLLDYLSGNPEKSLESMLDDIDDPAVDGEKPQGRTWISKICNISWPPADIKPEDIPEQAAILLLARDRLNRMARPANGASIAFTILVAAEEDATPRQSANKNLTTKRLTENWRKLWGPKRETPSPDEAAQRDSDAQIAKEGVDGAIAPPPPEAETLSTANDVADRPIGVWDGETPSRASLARLAFPGLIRQAKWFRVMFGGLIIGLFLWLIVTCLLSWNVAAGNAILVRFDKVAIARADLAKNIEEVESATDPSKGTSQTTPGTYVRYCDRIQYAGNDKREQFESVKQQLLCDQHKENEKSYHIARENLADWLAGWGWIRYFLHSFCGSEPCLASDPKLLQAGDSNIEWAALVLNTLAIAVLPLCYGILGAGAAVVRNIWARTRDSLLAPRDLMLSLGQLALGAVIGACIGLFISPSGGSVGLTGTITLSASALSFIAGFGVEGVFVALESFVKRVFNLEDAK